MCAEQQVLKTRLMRVDLRITGPRQPAYLKVTHSLNTILEEEDDDDDESDEEHVLFSRTRVEILFTKRQKNELRIANDGIAYPYHEFMKHYLGKCDYFWEHAKLLPQRRSEKK